VWGEDVSGQTFEGLLRCRPEDEQRAREILAAWPDGEPLPVGFAVEDAGTFRRLTATDGVAAGYILVGAAQWTDIEAAALADHLARVLKRYAERARPRT